MFSGLCYNTCRTPSQVLASRLWRWENDHHHLQLSQPSWALTEAAPGQMESRGSPSSLVGLWTALGNRLASEASGGRGWVCTCIHKQEANQPQQSRRSQDQDQRLKVVVMVIYSQACLGSALRRLYPLCESDQAPWTKIHPPAVSARTAWGRGSTRNGGAEAASVGIMATVLGRQGWDELELGQRCPHNPCRSPDCVCVCMHMYEFNKHCCTPTVCQVPCWKYWPLRCTG